MEFHRWPTMFDCFSGQLGKRWLLSSFGTRDKQTCVKHFYSAIIGRTMAELLSGKATNRERHHCTIAEGMSEAGFMLRKQPFYNVWPAILPALARIDLSRLKWRDFRPMMPDAISIRLPVGREYIKDQGTTVRSMLVTPIHLSARGMNSEERVKHQLACMMGKVPRAVRENCMGMYMFLDVGETCTVQTGFGPVTGPMRTFQIIPFPDETPDGVFADLLGNAEDTPELQKGKIISSKLLRECLALYVALSLIAADRDSELIERIVLTKDRDEYLKTRNSDLVKKAESKNVVGWEIGRGMETTPHFRRPHFGIRWTGTGRTVPRVVPVKGSLVNRKKLKEVPHGYAGEEESVDPKEGEA